MGTSPAMLDKLYGHLLPDALDRARAALDAFTGSQEVENERAWRTSEM